MSYDPTFVEDLTVPSLALLGKLSASDLITITVNNTEDIAESLRDVTETASTKGVRFELIGDVTAKTEAPQEEAADARLEAENVPAPQERPEPLARHDDGQPDDGAGPVQHDDAAEQGAPEPDTGGGLEQFATHPDPPYPK